MSVILRKIKRKSGTERRNQYLLLDEKEIINRRNLKISGKKVSNSSKHSSKLEPPQKGGVEEPGSC